MKKMKRIISMILVCALVLSTFVINVGAADDNGLGKTDLTYMNVRDDNALELYGLYMDQETNLFPRMDLNVAQDISNGVFVHAKESSGGRIRFKTNSSYIAIKAELPTYIEHSQTADAAMGDGKYGFDVYVDTEDGSTYVGTIAPDDEDVPTTDQAWSYEGIYDFGTAAERNITIYFPILQEVSNVYVGVQESATVAEHAIPYEEEAPIVYYGSSITQGASATRPGLTYVNTIGRSLNRDYVNLGMFGSCKAETAFANYIAGLDMSIFVYDHDHNYNTAADLEKGHEALFKIVREAHPDIPIIFISRPSKTAEWEAQREVIKKTYNNAIANGDKNVYFIDGQTFFNGNKDYLADTVHPNDKGQAAMAETIGNVLQGIIDGRKADDSYWFTDDFSYTAEEFANTGWTNKDNIALNETTGKLGVGIVGNTDGNGGAYTYLGGNPTVSGAWQDYVVEADVKITDGLFYENVGGTALVCLIVGADKTASSSADGYQFMMAVNGYQLLDRTNDGIDAVDSSKQTREFSTNVEYTLKIVVRQKQLLCYIDDELAITYNYKGENETPFSGLIGFRAAKQIAEVDNVCITSADSEAWFADAFSATSLSDDWVKPNYNAQTVTDSVLNTNCNGVYYLNEGWTWSNYIVEADVTIMSDKNSKTSTEPGTGWAGIYFAAAETAKGYDFCLCYGKAGTTSVWVSDRTGTKRVNIPLDNSPSINTGTSYSMKVVVSGNTFTCYLDGVEVVKRTVDGVENLTGTVGLTVSGYKAQYDNVSVKSSEEIPFFKEKFDDQTVTDITEIGWTNSSRNQIKDGTLKIGATTGGDTVYSYLKGYPISATMNNYIVEADIKMTGESIKGGSTDPLCAIVVGATETADDGLDGYQFLLSTGGKVSLLDRFGTAKDMFADIVKTGIDVKTGVTYNLKVVVNGKSIKCYMDDKLMIEHTCITDDTNPFAGLIGFRAGVNAIEVDNVFVRPAVQYDDNYYDVSYYRDGINTMRHPYKAGYVFAGWYADEACNTPYTSTTTTGYAYAKWVADEVLSVKAQLPAGQVVDDNGRTVMRIVTTTDCDDYTETGFDVSTVNQSKTYTDTRLFTTIKAKSEYSSVAVDYTPSGTFHANSKYFSTIILYNLKATDDHLTKKFTIKPFWVTADGTKVYGVTRVLTIQEGIDALSNATPVSPYSL